MVVNLAAGLDTRPYRMALPATLQWIEVDLPGILSYKEEILASEKPACVLERVRLDLSDATARRELFTQLGRRAAKSLILTEGLIIYFSVRSGPRACRGSRRSSRVSALDRGSRITGPSAFAPEEYESLTQ